MNQLLLAFATAVKARKASLLLSVLAIGTRPLLFTTSRAAIGGKA